MVLQKTAGKMICHTRRFTHSCAARRGCPRTTGAARPQARTRTPHPPARSLCLYRRSEAMADPAHPVDDMLDSCFASRYVSEPIAKHRWARGSGRRGGGLLRRCLRASGEACALLTSASRLPRAGGPMGSAGVGLREGGRWGASAGAREHPRASRPNRRLPEHGTPAHVVYQLIRDGARGRWLAWARCRLAAPRRPRRALLQPRGLAVTPSSPPPTTATCSAQARHHSLPEPRLLCDHLVGNPGGRLAAGGR